MPFIFVQLPPYSGTKPEFRESQKKIWLSTANTAMVTTLDVGDANDIHPANKRPVGERMALAARALAYGEKVEYSGPVPRRAKPLGADSIVVEFDHAESGLVLKDDISQGFEIAEESSDFVPAEVEILDSTLVMRSIRVNKPTRVRYAWKNVPNAVLFNKDQLPAPPFQIKRE